MLIDPKQTQAVATVVAPRRREKLAAFSGGEAAVPRTLRGRTMAHHALARVWAGGTSVPEAMRLAVEPD